MSRQVIHGSTSDQLATAGTEYMPAFGTRVTNSNTVPIRWPAAGTIRHLIVWLSAAPGVGKSRTIALQTGGTSRLSVTISGTDTTGEDTSSYSSVSAGDTFRVASTATDTPAAAYLRYAYLWEPTTEGQTVCAVVTDGAELSDTAEFLPLSGCCYGPYGVGSYSHLALPIPGVVSNMYVNLATAPGVGKKNRQFQFRKNGATDANFKVNISEASTTGEDTSDTVSVVDGDYVNFRSAIFGAPAEDPPNDSYVAMSCVFTATDTDYYLVGNTGDDTLPTGTTTEYRHVQTGGDIMSASQTGKLSIAHRCLFERARFKVTALPDSPGEWGFRLDWLGGPTATFTSTSATSQLSIAPKMLPINRGFGQYIAAANVPAGPPSSTVRFCACYACKMVPMWRGPFMF